jgi:hypothetical protein
MSLSPELASFRNLLRQRTLGAERTFRRATVKVQLPGPDGSLVDTELDVVQPSVGARGRILTAAGASGGKVEDPGKLQTLAILECVVVPGTLERVFSAEDFQAIYEWPAGGWPDVLWAQVAQVMNPDTAGAAGK